MGSFEQQPKTEIYTKNHKLLLNFELNLNSAADKNGIFTNFIILPFCDLIMHKFAVEFMQKCL